MDTHTLRHSATIPASWPYGWRLFLSCILRPELLRAPRKHHPTEATQGGLLYTRKLSNGQDQCVQSRTTMSAVTHKDAAIQVWRSPTTMVKTPNLVPEGRSKSRKPCNWFFRAGGPQELQAILNPLLAVICFTRSPNSGTLEWRWM